MFFANYIYLFLRVYTVRETYIKVLEVYMLIISLQIAHFVFSKKKKKI